MLKRKLVTASSMLMMLLFVAAGCSQNESEPANSADKSTAGHTDHSEHAHPSEGPHGGELIELGNEEYHAELLHDENAGTVTIYVLDAHAETAVPLDVTELMINLKHDGQAEQHKLAASPDAGDPEGKSSRFVSSDSELGEDLEHEAADPQLVVMINGKQYRGKIEHGEHDHEEGHHH